MSKKFYITISLLLLIGSFLLFFYSTPKPPLKIGLMVSLTGPSPELGRSIRDGVFLAVEEINKEGGIKGRKINLIIKDNKANQEIAKLNYMEFVNENVLAVIGPSTSSMARALLPIINENKLLTISPTVSSTEFSEKEDYFINIAPNNRNLAEILAIYVNEKIKPKKVLILADERNPVYVSDFGSNFLIKISKYSKKETLKIPEQVSDYDTLVAEALRRNPDFILMITDVFNASIITQKIKKLNPSIKLAICPWARFSGFLLYSGFFSEEVLSVGYYDESEKNENFKKFKEKFIAKFGYHPDSAVLDGYYSVMIIKEALLKKSDIKTLRDEILNSSFKFSLGEIKINRYGDPERECFPVIVRKGNFERLER